MYKVFYENRSFNFISSKACSGSGPKPVVVQFRDVKHLHNLTDLFLSQGFDRDVYLVCPTNLEAAFEAFKSHFHLSQTGGGLIKDKQGKVLFIYRNGFWDLPKGHLETGETIDACALREVYEETGLSELQLIGQVAISWHIYDLNNKTILKSNTWFLMHTASDQSLKLEQKEGITDAKWVSKEEIPYYLKRCYRSIAETLGTVIKSL
jgi:8-oxo-dGTP pyrophosphatase MutT (NUDIX family)